MALMNSQWMPTGESGVGYLDRLENGFFDRFMSGGMVLDIGYDGSHEGACPVLEHAVGIDLGYPGYDGITLPFANDSVDCVYSSHMLEHTKNYQATIREWHRVLKVGGFIVTIVPHQFLYEKKQFRPSRFNHNHKRFYTPAKLLREFEKSLEPNTYRVRHLRDNDAGFAYSTPPEAHSSGAYEIELVIEKITPPAWKLTPWCWWRPLS